MIEEYHRKGPKSLGLWKKWELFWYVWTCCLFSSIIIIICAFLLFLLGIYKVGAVCMCSLSQLVGYISFSITPGCWALVTLGMMVCSLKVFPDLVVHTGVFFFSPYVTVSSSAQLFFLDTRLCFHDFNLRTVLWKHAVRGFPSFFFLCET